MSGNYAEILKHLPSYMKDYDFDAFCQNHKSYEICRDDNSFELSFYLYEKFNIEINSLDIDALKEEVPFNLFKVLIRDKAHFKRLAAKKQEKVIFTMYSIMNDWLIKSKPDYVFLPIIESIDSMLLYYLAKAKNIQTICYGHARQVNRSYFSDSYLEELPRFKNKIPTTNEHLKSANEFLENYINNPSKMNYAKQLEKLYLDFEDKNQESYTTKKSVLMRLFINISLKMGKEKWNQLLLLWIKVLVNLERIVLPIQKQAYLIFELIYLRPLKSLPEKFDYFPLHFSPESSINTPAPYYIDQMRVIDEIMLKREANHILIVKEHPAMYLKRNFSFYRLLKKKPFVRIISKKFNSQELILKADCTYSVTGTACLEAFLLGKKWHMLGSIFLKEYIKVNPEASVQDFLVETLKTSGEFVLFSPPRIDGIHKKALFAKQNLSNMANYFRFYIQETAF